VIFFFNGASTTEIYSLSLHDALPISNVPSLPSPRTCCECSSPAFLMSILLDRKSTRLNSSHVEMSYAVFCLKKERIATTVSYKLSIAEAQLYRSVTNYVSEEFNRAEALMNDKQAGTFFFALAILQLCLLSSPDAIYH